LKKLIILSIFFTFSFVQNCCAQIDTTTINKFTAYFFLSSQDTTKREMAYKYIADSIFTIEPDILMMAGMMLYSKGYKDSSMYWLFLGEIRARFLASLYNENSNTALYSSFHAIAMGIVKEYAKNNVQVIYIKLNQALENDSLNPLNPLEFLDSLSDTSQYIPRQEWKQHYYNVRQTYYHLEQEILQNGNSIFEDDNKKKTKPK